MLPSKVIHNKAGRCVPLLLAALIFAGCSGQGPQTSSVDVQGAATGTSDSYLQQMQQSSNDNKVDWQLLAIRALLKEGKIPQASDQLASLPQQLSDTQHQESLLLQAQLKAMQQDTGGAAQLLQQVNTGSLSKDQLARYYQLQIAAGQGRPSLDLLRAYIAQEPLLTSPADKQKNIDATWLALTQLTPAQTGSLVINADENTLQGWLDLLNVYKANVSDPTMLKAGISDWQTRYPENPAAKMLPTALSQVQNFQQSSTGKIALLLPLNGQAQIFAKAIQKGFDDARNGALAQAAVPPQTDGSNATAAAGANPAASPASATGQNAAASPSSATGQNAAASPASATGQNTAASPSSATGQNAAVSPASAAGQNAATNSSAAQPAGNTTQPAATDGAAQPAASGGNVAQTAPPSSSAQVQVYDTSSQPIDQVLAQAQKDGATLVVGPLLKSNVDRLASLPTPLNILALNEPEAVQNHPNLCYFALSPEDEARDAAHHMWDQGKRSPLLMVPRSSLGDRVSKAFAAEWQKLGGGTVLQQQFGSQSELKQGINSGAGLRLTGTPIVSQQTQQPQGVTVAGLTIPAPQAPVSSGDGSVDSLYIVATQDEMALIKPMISMRVSSRSMAQIYASSRSYQAGSGPDYRLEMEGVQFSDIPLLSGSNPALMQQAAKSFNNDYSQVRLYAMGVDAWTLANHFNEVRQLPGFQLKGETGSLSATQDCVINRKLVWSQYRQGQIVPAS
ncbi:penicillin-binding protein activator [Erwinia phyllosphaerae]|uniref:penicillin-binding protein activator n=1 Tax=Erwinia phyllosphaerae TaxID=2853256 RepID=UPI001FEF90E2|nr:penicillin-binding protein activator [Erwinia phyllosphaerae]MBV4368112.1 penicillin-binding protein activator [Erwinia phyllosphaerae]